MELLFHISVYVHMSGTSGRPEFSSVYKRNSSSSPEEKKEKTVSQSHARVRLLRNGLILPFT